MKNKIQKNILILFLILTLSLANFFVIGINVSTYAANTVATNNANVDFDVYFKTEEGTNVDYADILYNGENAYMYISVAVKNEGYFNGKVSIDNAVLEFVESSNTEISSLTKNELTIHQINAGSSVNLKVKVKPVINEVYDASLLNKKTEVSLSGIYRDSTERDIDISAKREITVKLIENNTNTELQNLVEVITNKVINIEGTDKRVIQVKYDIGLVENNYPIKKIEAEFPIPTIDGKVPTVDSNIQRYNMSSLNWDNSNGTFSVVLENNQSSKNLINWKTQKGYEEIILTYIYDGSVVVDNQNFLSDVTLTLHNDKVLESRSQNQVDGEKDSIVEIKTVNTQTNMHKGDLYADKDTEINTKTTVTFNYAKIVDIISVNELQPKYLLENDTTTVDANISYKTTTINKQNFLDILGDSGVIDIYDDRDRVVAKIINTTEADADGNIVIDYGSFVTGAIRIEATAPIKDGTLEINHVKNVGQIDADTEKRITELQLISNVQYNIGDITESDILSSENRTVMQETITKMEFAVNKETLSTTTVNNVEMNIDLLTNSQMYDLYENPKMTITMPNEVTGITINSVDLLYDNNLTIKNYVVDGQNINIELQGKQTEYSSETVKGASLKVNVDLTLDKTAGSADEKIVLTYLNDNAKLYNTPTMGQEEVAIKIVAPTDVTLVNAIDSLNISELGENATKVINLQKSAAEVTLTNSFEINNNNSEAIEDIKIMLNLPTDNTKNNVGIEIATGINVAGGNGITIYSTENENATDDVTNTQNGWTQNGANAKEVKKYLVTIDELAAKSTVTGSYQFKVPANLEYNKIATSNYSVEYANSTTGVTKEMNSTPLEFNSGIGAKVETSISATVKNLTIEGTVKTGEVIKYTVIAKNIGTEVANNITITGIVPNGTVLVEPKADFVYDGTTYYEEKTNTEVTKQVASLNAGEELVLEYEVRVKADGTTINEIKNISNVKFGEATIETKELVTDVEKGDIQVEIKRVTDDETPVTEFGSIDYYVSIKNISSQAQDNVLVKTYIPEFNSIQTLDLTHFDSTGKNIETKSIEYSESINIGTIGTGEEKVLRFDLAIDQLPDNQTDTSFSVEATTNGNTYNSNEWVQNVITYDMDVSMTTTAEKYIKTEEIVKYEIAVKNTNSMMIPALEVISTIPEQLEIQKILVNNVEIENIYSATNEFTHFFEIAPNETITIIIETMVEGDATRTEAETISTKAQINIYGKILEETADVINIIEANPNYEEDNDVEDGNVSTGNKSISGIAWLDTDGDGRKEQGEEALANIEVKLLNVDTNQYVKNTSGQEISVKTDSVGSYIIPNIGNGKYIAVFNYPPQYSLSKYEVNGVTESENSNVSMNELNINNVASTLASTDILVMNNDNISNINIGLIDAKIFDLELEKYITKIVIQNDEGTTQTEYNNSSLTKLEIDADLVEGTTAIIEYNIVITNNGEIEGYAKEVVDYIPSDLKFSSELNKTWYQTTEGLANRSLENEVIKPGETKILSLVLMKTLTKENTGLINNTAEIAEAYNELGIEDTNSTPGNKDKNENDYSYADAIISIRTGGGIYVIGILTIIAVAIIPTVTIIVIKKRKNKLV